MRPLIAMALMLVAGCASTGTRAPRMEFSYRGQLHCATYLDAMQAQTSGEAHLLITEGPCPVVTEE